MFGLCDMAKWLYVFKDPMGQPDVKIGITGHPKSRLGTYQNAMSPRSHRACFDFVWIGPDNQIDKLERVLKAQYNWDIASDKMGESEWVQNITVAEIQQSVQTMIEGFHFHIKPLEAEFPVRQDDCPYKVNNTTDKSTGVKS
jgi:hypothetical protein